MLRQVRQLSFIAAACLIAGCKKEATEEATPPKPPSGEATPYSVAIAPNAPYAVGKDAAAAITVTSKDGFHVNPDYPVAFKVEGSSAVKFADARVKLADGKKTPCADKAEDACAVEFVLPFTPETAGDAKVSGVIAFSVCSHDKCLIEKVPLTLAIAVQ